MSEVILFKDHLLKKIKNIIAENCAKKFNKGDRIVIKTHLGEYGNLNYIRPPIIEAVVDELKKIGVKPFIFDTLTLYSGDRDTVEKHLETARKNGFTEETVGCPIIISDEGMEVKSKFFGKIEIAKKMYDADGMVVISHFKGHELTTFGGAIKNIGMGGATNKGKSTLHHNTQPQVQDNCVGCGLCAAICPEKAIKINNGKANIDSHGCFGCCNCVDICPNQAIKETTTSLAKGLAEVCSIFQEKFGKKIYYINVLLDISEKCDCYPIGQSDCSQVVAPNIGITASDDLLAIDQASLDLVEEATHYEFGKHFKSDPLKQIKAAAEFKLGSKEYKLISY